jgi:membrane protease YdiL (CAAX protease family)
MIIAITLLMVGLAGFSIFRIRALTAHIKTAWNSDQRIDETLKFQLAQLVLAALVLLITFAINPENFKTYFQLGNLSAPASGVSWLGIAPGDPWWQPAVSMGFFITLATSIFMYFQMKQAGVPVLRIFKSPGLIAWAVLFSVLNAFSEEVIFRVGIVSPLMGQVAVPIVLLISGFIFGLPHYFGMPKGVLGALMASFLGWLLAMSLVETQGLLIPWAVHFVQDVVIISSILVISRAQSVK